MQGSSFLPNPRGLDIGSRVLTPGVWEEYGLQKQPILTDINQRVLSMKVVIQRVSKACVKVDDTIVGNIDGGLLILLGVVKADEENDAKLLAKKCCELRIFEDDAGKMNRSVKDVGGSLLVISQFTLAANCKKGRRPSFDDAAPPDIATKLYEFFCDECRKYEIHVETGRFAARMGVELTNDGPVTIYLDSKLN